MRQSNQIDFPFDYALAFVDASMIKDFHVVLSFRNLWKSGHNEYKPQSELKALCEWASHEQDPQKLFELTKRINELLEDAERKKHPQNNQHAGISRSL